LTFVIGNLTLIRQFPPLRLKNKDIQAEKNNKYRQGNKDKIPETRRLLPLSFHIKSKKQSKQSHDYQRSPLKKWAEIGELGDINAHD